jgi:hypothetical protein
MGKGRFYCGLLATALFAGLASPAVGQSPPEPVAPTPIRPPPSNSAPLPPAAVASEVAPPPQAFPTAEAPANAVPSSAIASPGGPGDWFNPVVGQVPYRADFRVLDFPDEPVRGQPTNLGYVQSDLGVTLPVWQDAPDEWAATLRIRSEFFHTSAILPDTGQPFPQELWDVRFGTTFRHLFDNGWIAGGGVSFGSASDRPFSNFNVLTLGANVFLRVPEGEHNAWLFTLSYSPTSELPFPIPGVAFVWQPSDCFRMNIGLPFQVWYRPTDELTLELSYMLLRTVHARATYRFCPAVAVFGGYDWEDEGYFLADRPDTNDRFYYYDMRLSGGLQIFFGHGATLDFSGGYVFDRFYFEGRSFSNNGFNRVDVGNGPYANVRFAIRF